MCWCSMLWSTNGGKKGRGLITRGRHTLRLYVKAEMAGVWQIPSPVESYFGFNPKTPYEYVTDRIGRGARNGNEHTTRC